MTREHTTLGVIAVTADTSKANAYFADLRAKVEAARAKAEAATAAINALQGAAGRRPC